MAIIPKILILASSDEWFGAGVEDRPSGWTECWSAFASPSPEFGLVVAPAKVALKDLQAWRREVPAVDLLIVSREGDARLQSFFGDQGVYFFHPPGSLAELRSGITEVLSYRDARLKLESSGKAPPAFAEKTSVDGWLELTGPNHPVFLRRFRSWIESLGDLGLEQAEKQRLIHAVREVGWNAIEWGNRFDPGRALSLAFLALDDCILFRIQNESNDCGDWFSSQHLVIDPAKVQRERAERGFRPGGLGISLVRSIVDSIEVSSHGNVVILKKNLPPREIQGKQVPLEETLP